MKPTIARSLVLIAGIGVLIAGCSKGQYAADSAAGTTGSAAEGTPVSGGVLTHVRSDAPTCIDLQQSTLHSTLLIGRAIAASLTDQNTETGEIVPWLAQSWEVDQDGKRYTFHLRDNVTFSDGSPFDAAAVKANFDAVIALGAKSALAGSYLEGYVGTEAADEHTAVVTFSQPNYQFLQATSTPSLGILGPATFTQTPEARCQGGLVGAGPFTLEENIQNQKVVLKKRAGYDWPSALSKHTGEAYLDGIDIVISPESSVRTGGLASGEFDLGSSVAPQDEATLTRAGVAVKSRVVPGVPTSLLPNENRPLLNDKTIRVAITKAIDRREIVDTLYTPTYSPATSVLSPTTPGWSDRSEDLKYDLDGAVKSLEAAGWVPGADGIRTRDGVRLSVNVVTSSASTNYLQLVQQQLAKAGIELRIDVVSDPFVVQSSGNYDFFAWSFTRADPDALRTVFSSKYPQRKGQAVNPQLDSILASAASNSDLNARNELYAKAQQEIISSADDIPLTDQVQVYGVTSAVKGFTFDASARLDFYDTWKS